MVWLARSLAMLLDCACWGCGSTRSSWPWSCPTCVQSHVPAAVLTCDDVLFFQRHGGADISKSRDPFAHWNGEFFASHNFGVGFSCISPVFFVCGPGLRKNVKDYLCQRMGVFAFSVFPSQVGIVAASAAASGSCFMFSVVSQVASGAAAAWRHLLCGRCLRLGVCLRPDRKPCGGSMCQCVCVHPLFRRWLQHCVDSSCVWERVLPGCKPCGSSMRWCVFVHLPCRRCLCHCAYSSCVWEFLRNSSCLCLCVCAPVPPNGFPLILEALHNELVHHFWPCLVATTPCHEREGSRIAFAQAKATPRVDVAETPKEMMELEKPGCRFPVFVPALHRASQSRRGTQGVLGNLSVGDKEGIFSDGWTVVKKKQKTKKLICPSVNGFGSL